jgi:hypothetical protein
MKNKKVIQKVLIIIIILITVQTTGNAQKTEDIFRHSGDDIVWLGLDFTQVRLVGDLGTVSRGELIPLFDDINRLVISESSKFNFEAALRRDKIPYDIEIATKLNSDIDPGKAIAYASSDEQGRLNAETISVLVKQYKIEKPEGIGLIFFMETLDKVSEKGTMWVTFINLPDRNVLFTERMTGTAGGISFRNHWSRTVYEVIDEIRSTKYIEWKYRYAR